MRNTIKKTKIGNITIEHQKWHQGPLSEHMVVVYEGNRTIFEEDDMTSREATILYNNKVKEYKASMTNYEIKVKNDNREWVENYTVLSTIEPQGYFSKMIESFNDTLRHGEKTRILVSFEKVENNG